MLVGLRIEASHFLFHYADWRVYFLVEHYIYYHLVYTATNHCSVVINTAGDWWSTATVERLLCHHSKCILHERDGMVSCYYCFSFSCISFAALFNHSTIVLSSQKFEFYFISCAFLRDSIMFISLYLCSLLDSGHLTNVIMSRSKLWFSL